jgi:sterol desaturase/sphingolipid hydroxylase (fatty acid hydroxylase superfamily)
MTVGERLEQCLQHAATASLGDALGYGLIACGVWLFFYVAFRNRLQHRRISDRQLKSRQVPREILQSLRSIAIFGVVTGAVIYLALCGRTQLYENIGTYGWGWFFVSIGVMIVLHDTYFYWTHRLMHYRRLYHLLHHTHHLSTNPTPWAAYAFSPMEALVQAGIGPLIVFTIPVHPAAFALFMLWQISFNVFGHCGYEIFPRWFLRSPIGRILNSPTHHALHHEKFRANFGLYFNVWDRLMGTNDPDYEQRFERATDIPPAQFVQAGAPSPRRWTTSINGKGTTGSDSSSTWRRLVHDAQAHEQRVELPRPRYSQVKSAGAVGRAVQTNEDAA